MSAPSNKGSLEDQIAGVLRSRPEGATDDVMAKELPESSLQGRAAAINVLLGQHMLSMVMDPTAGVPIYRLQDPGDMVKFKGLGPEEMLIYQVIKNSTNLGIWTRDMKQKTNLAQPKINKILKALEERALIKHVKSVQNASRKVYMLMELQPAKEITGGPWYGPDAFDKEFIDILRQAVLRYIQQKGEGTLDAICEFITEKGISRQALQPEDMRAILETLMLDGKIEELENPEGDRVYRQAMVKIPERTAFASMPCGTCPVIGECVDGGPISPETCKYFEDWLSQGDW